MTNLVEFSDISGLLLIGIFPVDFIKHMIFQREFFVEIRINI